MTIKNLATLPMKFKSGLFSACLWWAVIGASIWIGGTIFMMSVIDPQWNSDRPGSVRFFFTQTSFNKYIWNFFGPPFMMLRSVVPQSLALILGWNYKFQRRYLIITLLCTMITVGFTLAYIYPINDVLMTHAGGDNSDRVIRGMANRWIMYDRIRFLINVVGYVFLLRAFRASKDL